jgi:hypothetical protein
MGITMIDGIHGELSLGENCLSVDAIPLHADSNENITLMAISHEKGGRGGRPAYVSPHRGLAGGRPVACAQQSVPDAIKTSLLVLFNDRFWVGWHHSRGFHPDLNLVLQFSQFRLREVLHLPMEEFFRVTSLGEVKGTPFIGILKDEPLVSLDGSILRLSLYHASLIS